MTFEVYALREIGSLEVRYVGQTRHSRSVRLNFLACLARAKVGEPNMREWLWDCGFAVEAVLLLETETREEAKAIETALIKSFWAAGHRLLNHQGVPKTARVEPIELAWRHPAKVA